jgi:peptidoglycan/xylan/chitin deacetylase (PgdA/CDA1 family)
VCLLFHDVYAADPAESGFCSPAADRYKLTLMQFEQHLSGLARLRPPVLPFALTFDDAGASFYTAVADRLEALGWRASCFVPTSFIGRNGFLTGAQIQELDRRGHHIGSHSATHPLRISACAAGVMRQEWARSLDVLQNLLGRPVTSASVPGGYFSKAVAEAAAAAGVRTLFTSEPVTRVHFIGECAVIGRFAIRHNSPADLSARLVRTAPWSRWTAWASWNTKGAIKPILGPAYMRVADWLMAQKATGH